MIFQRVAVLMSRDDRPAGHETGPARADIEPGKVMITRRGVVKVMDFAVARAMRSGGPR
jgi:hypothetical protein